MLFGKPLFSSKNAAQIFTDILKGNFSIPKTISIQARNFFYFMLKEFGNDRSTSTQLLNHEFIVGDYHKFTHYDININNNKNLNININNNNKNIFNNINGNVNENLVINNNNIKRSATEPNYDNKDATLMGQFNMAPPCIKLTICVGCDKNISDFIYKCSTGFRLNICENCYLNSYKTHPHNFLKCKVVSSQPNNQLLNNNINKIDRFNSGPQIPQQGGNQNKPKSEHKHPLIHQQQINDQCKLCLKNIGGQTGYKCGLCEIVLCKNCAKSVFFGNKKRNVHEHFLDLTFRQNWICDICRKPYDKKASYYCELCDFDACDKCYIQY